MNSFKAVVVTALAIALVVGLAVYAFGDPQEEQTATAVAAAEEWLALVDAGDYDGSWENASRLLKTAVTTEQWAQQAGAARNPLGAVVSREVGSTTYATELPGAPDGNYVVIVFTTTFENKATAHETVTPALEDGAWRVAGYYVR